MRDRDPFVERSHPIDFSILQFSFYHSRYNGHTFPETDIENLVGASGKKFELNE